MNPATFVSSVVALTVATRRRVVLAVLALALALGVVAAPGLSGTAEAATAVTPHVTQSWAGAMLAMLNGERAAHGLRPLTMNPKLIRSAFYHNYRMAKHNTMSHQLPGEAFFATRISNQGYHWMAAGENIGWNSSVSLSGLKALETAMYDEVAPNDGHRQNILSHEYTQVGIQVRFDRAHHKIWFTQDFGRPE